MLLLTTQPSNQPSVPLCPPGYAVLRYQTAPAALPATPPPQPQSVAPWSVAEGSKIVMSSALLDAGGKGYAGFERAMQKVGCEGRHVMGCARRGGGCGSLTAALAEGECIGWTGGASQVVMSSALLAAGASGGKGYASSLPCRKWVGRGERGLWRRPRSKRSSTFPSHRAAPHTTHTPPYWLVCRCLLPMSKCSSTSPSL